MRTQSSAVRRAILAALLIMAMMLPGASLALSNTQLQLAGGYAAIHGNETYFFAQTDDNKWGLYALSTCTTGPVATLDDVKPARLLYADSTQVCFLAARPDGGFLLASVNLKNGSPTMLIEKINECYAESEDTMFYSSAEDKLTLYRYSFTKNTSTKLKTMTSKNIYDAMLSAKEKVYFLGQDIKDGSLVAYEINKPGAKAVNLNPTNPKMGDAYLYGGYTVYSPKGDTTQVYTVPMGKEKGIRIGENILGMSLTNNRFGDALYPYDSQTNSIVRVPLDGSQTSSLALTTTGQSTIMMGGTDDGIYFLDDNQIYKTSLTLSDKTPLFAFQTADEGIHWTNISPTATNKMLMLGYTVATYLESSGVTLPTAVRVMDPATGQMLFQAPEKIPTVEEGAPDPNAAMPQGGSDKTAPAETESPISEDEDTHFFDIIGG